MTFPAVSEIVPHTGPAVLLDCVLSADDSGICCQAIIGPHMWFADDEGVTAAICLELMAQTVAAFSGLRNRRTGMSVEPAFLVSCRELNLEVNRLQHGDIVEIHAQVVFAGRGPLASFTCEVLRRGERLASGSVNVYEGDRVPNGV